MSKEDNICWKLREEEAIEQKKPERDRDWECKMIKIIIWKSMKMRKKLYRERIEDEFKFWAQNHI